MAVKSRKEQYTVSATAAQLAAANIIFDKGIFIIESDTDKTKEADGIHPNVAGHAAMYNRFAIDLPFLFA